MHSLDGNGLQQMLRMNPQLHIFHDASYHDMYYMNLSDKRLDSLKNCIGRKTVQEEFTKKHDCYDRVMKELFNDPYWVKQNINPRDLNWKLFEMAGLSRVLNCVARFLSTTSSMRRKSIRIGW